MFGYDQCIMSCYYSGISEDYACVAISFTTPQFARLQALCDYLQRPLRNLQAPQDPAPAEDAQ